MVTPPETDEGWYVLHDFRTIEWDAWQTATAHERTHALESGISFLESCEAVDDAPDGESAVFTVLGHEADLLVMHLRPTLDELSALERQFERTGLGQYTSRSASYVAMTEVSGYVSDDYFADEEVSPGLQQYIDRKLKPSIPADEYMCFYPMNKRRGEHENWYTLPFEERAELMESHGAIGKQYAGEVSQVVSNSVGLDSHEWGITLFADDPVSLKDIVYEMRFDEASAKYGDFPYFYSGRRFPPADLAAFFAGQTVPTDDEQADSERSQHGANSDAIGGQSDESDRHTGHPSETIKTEGADADAALIRDELAAQNIYAGQPHGEDVHATVIYSTASPETLFDEIEALRPNFEHYETHVKTAVYEGDTQSAVVSLWETASAAETAAGFLSELPAVVERERESGFGTMGLFYTVVPEHRDDFVGTFEDVGSQLEEMDGHHDSTLLVNVEDEQDMFISSQWDSKADAMTFFGSDAFAETVDYGRDILADRPRHVFLE
ncbi:heme-binding protein [Natronolimnobius sp. AArcel1]|uniref:heme-binding protein n=1 Tax=Natronolimnobius sp. AArcel1 TaxID=1679093 RepID=UPI0013EAE8A0|nr:heme-binding protein [Natronolimnobius sp. AArcel1]